MKQTTLAEFQEELRQTGAYRTKDDHRAKKRAKKNWLTTLRYSWGSTSVFPKCAITEPLGILNQHRWAGFCFDVVRTAEKLGMSLTVEGFEHLRDLNGPCVVLSNHMSTTETILLPPILLAARPISYVAKASLAHLPFLEKAAAHTGMVEIGRQSPREDLVHILKEGVERIKRGDNFLIFPQGTRSPVFSHRKFSSIGAKLAEKAGVPIIPIVVDTRCQPTRPGGPFKDLGTVDPSIDLKVAIGSAIPLSKAKEMQEATFDWMANKLESWGLPTER